MIKSIIADNDIDNQNNFKAFIRSSSTYFQVVRTIDDTKDIFGAVAETDARLVIADVRFFGSSGYYKIKKLSQYFPDLRLILYGTYNDSQYMKKALDDCCITYMFKPVKQQELIRTLNAAADEFRGMEKRQKEQANMKNMFEQNMPMFEDRFLINLVHGNLDNDNEIQDYIDYFEINLVSKYTVFVISIDNFRQVSLALDESERNLLIFSMLHLVSDYFNKIENGKAFINHFNSITGIIGGMTPNDSHVLCGILREEIKSKFSISVTIGLGESFEKLSEISFSYKQAKAALRYTYCMGEGTVISIGFVEPDNKITYSYPLKKEELLVYNAVAGNTEEAMKYINDICDALEKNASLVTPLLLGKILLDIVVSISRMATESNSIADSEFAHLFSVKDIIQIESIEKGREYLKSAVYKFCMLINDKWSSKNKFIFDFASLYAKENYYESISISKAALKAGCTPMYLNKIFQANLEKTYYDYVIEVRMDVAKKLLENIELTDEAIALAIGYEDEKFFKSVFLKKEGFTTNEFRMRLERSGAV